MSNELQSLRDDVRRVERLLISMLENQGHIHYVNSYHFGRTKKNGDLFIVLYPTGKLKFKACKVYQEEFDKLPVEMTADAANQPDFIPNCTDKDEAAKAGILRDCATMCVLTANGQDTSMGPEKRFQAVIWVSNKQSSNSSSAQSSQTAQKQTSSNTSQTSQKQTSSNTSQTSQKQTPKKAEASEEFRRVAAQTVASIESKAKKAFGDNWKAAIGKELSSYDTPAMNVAELSEVHGSLMLERFDLHAKISEAASVWGKEKGAAVRRAVEYIAGEETGLTDLSSGQLREVLSVLEEDRQAARK